MTQSTQTVLRKTEDTLYTAKLGLDQMKDKDPKARIAGLRNLVVFGRAVTNVLQNLRPTVGKSFDEWYQPKVDAMRDDPVLKYFYNLRSQILKEGTVNTTSSVLFSGNPAELKQKFPAPPGAKGFFIGDNLGGCGWHVEVTEGVTERYYVDVPENIENVNLKIDVYLTDTPAELKGHTIQELSNHYVTFLSKLVDEAKEVFS